MRALEVSTVGWMSLNVALDTVAFRHLLRCVSGHFLLSRRGLEREPTVEPHSFWYRAKTFPLWLYGLRARRPNRTVRGPNSRSTNARRTRPSSRRRSVTNWMPAARGARHGPSEGVVHAACHSGYFFLP